MSEFSVIGKSVPRVDALEKVTGKAKYSVDLRARMRTQVREREL